jgi:hypothetical protein
VDKLIELLLDALVLEWSAVFCKQDRIVGLASRFAGSSEGPIRKRSILMSYGFVLAAGVAQAGIPLFNPTCGGNISVHADMGGPVYINGK